MKPKLGSLLVVIALLAFPGFVSADTITTLSVASVGTTADSNQINSTGNPTIAIAPNASWGAALAGSSWVSYGLTGDTSAPGFFVVPNNTSVDFYDTFTLAGTPTGGTLNVMADDTAAVYLNDTLLVAAGTTLGQHCSDTLIGCLSPYTFALPTNVLRTGSNTLDFRVTQLGGSSFGLDYAGSVTDPVATPEPSTLVLLFLGLGLLVLGDVRLRRYSSKVRQSAGV